MSCIQYICCCLSFSIAKPFRKPIWTNPVYFVSVIFMLGFQIYLILGFDSVTSKMFDLVEFPVSYRHFLLAIVIANCVLTYMFEKIVISWFSRYWNQKQASKLKDKHLDYIKSLDNAYVQEDHTYTQKGVRVPQNTQLRDKNDDGVGGHEKSEVSYAHYKGSIK